MASPSSGQLIDDMETSFQACLAAITNPDNYSVHDSEEVKTGVEQTIQRFLDLAKQMECFFLQKRLLLSVQKPEQIILEDINELKNELARKEQLLQKYYEKLQYWQNLIDSSATSRPPQPQQPMATMGPAQPQQQPMPQVGPPPPPPPPPPPQQMQTPPMPQHQMAAPAQQPGPPPQYQQQHFPSQPTSVSPSAPGQGMPGMPPGQQGMMPQTHQMHPVQHMMTHQSPAAMQGGLQSPLAYLERTTSNIGMPDPRR